MRVDGLVNGGGGLLLLLVPRAVLSVTGIYNGEPVWPQRLAGSLLIALGVLLLLSAQDRIVSTASMVAMLIANTLMAIVLVVSYLQGEFSGMSLFGQIALILLFLVCVISAIVPVRYLRTDYVVL
jgi:drug/metabolite transporter (DMT)-like permease